MNENGQVRGRFTLPCVWQENRLGQVVIYSYGFAAGGGSRPFGLQMQ